MAAVAFFSVLLVGVYLVGAHHKVEHPAMITTVTKSAVNPIAGSATSTQTVRNGKKTTTTWTTTSTPAGSPKSTETTTVAGGQSFFERVLGDDGDVFLRIGVILLAAFIVGAVIQRVLVGQYGGIKVGTVEIADIATASDEAVEELKDALAKVQQDSSTKLGEAEAAVKELQADLATMKADSLEREAKLNRTLALIATRLATLGEQANDGGT